MTERKYIDNETGAYGDVDDLHFVDDIPGSVINVIGNDALIEYGAKYGVGMEDIIQSAKQAASDAAIANYKPDVTFDQFVTLADAVDKLIDAITKDGICPWCEQGYNFHGSNCLTHDINNAVGQVE